MEGIDQGSHGRAMGSAPAPHVCATTPCRWPGPPLARSPGRAERDPLDLAHWCPMEGSADTLAALSHRSSALSTVGALGCPRPAPPRPGEGAPRARWARALGVRHRWPRWRGEHRGPGVGTTTRGTGPKVMAVADRAGLPVAVHMARASPHAVPRVAPPLAAWAVDARPARLIGANAYESAPLEAH